MLEDFLGGSLAKDALVVLRSTHKERTPQGLHTTDSSLRLLFWEGIALRLRQPQASARNPEPSPKPRPTSGMLQGSALRGQEPAGAQLSRHAVASFGDMHANPRRWAAFLLGCFAGIFGRGACVRPRLT